MANLQPRGEHARAPNPIVLENAGTDFAQNLRAVEHTSVLDIPSEISDAPPMGSTHEHQIRSFSKTQEWISLIFIEYPVLLLKRAFLATDRMQTQ